VLQGEYPTIDRENMEVGEIIRQQQYRGPHTQVQEGNVIKRRGKRVVELDFNDEEADDEVGVDWLDGEAGELMVVTRTGNGTVGKAVSKRRSLGGSTQGNLNDHENRNGNGNGNGAPAAKRPRV